MNYIPLAVPVAIAAALIAIILPASRRIARKAGYNPALGLLMVVSPINLVLLWKFAGAQWPIERRMRELEAAR
jgi:hypothetical protein